MALFDCLGDTAKQKEQLRFATITNGEQFVMTDGTVQMLKLSAGS